MQVIEYSIDVAASPMRVWQTLTEPAQMNAWVGEPEMNVQVTTDWVVGGPIALTALHHAKFRNWGTVLHFEPPVLLRYTQLSSISRLPDVPASYTTVEMRLTPIALGTRLTVHLTGFPTESIYKHLDFYWRGTMGVLQRRLTGG